MDQLISAELRHSRSKESRSQATGKAKCQAQKNEHSETHQPAEPNTELNGTVCARTKTHKTTNFTMEGALNPLNAI